ncbi:STAS domain-containing protein [Aureibacter tunicatorum]|uniref:Anti-sigma factor antagonist n=1 Tax=Aureibacter tunicatorum TaxID=866807 RepID=A0AAE3XQB2_9BACT|nr:STAS domain-containing protein [Aureibacter tunicatorum]MDR6240128.1 anti-sigma B factor antagonist [Aureibacter tunicatorum]BDD05991.1 hypothetical protein AUTU_34740 [Aureibacter tunicatorum]
MIDISIEHEEGTAIIAVKGEVDASSSIYLDDAFKKVIPEEPKAIMVNLEHLEYISSAGLGVFMSYIEELNNKNIPFIIFSLNEKVKNVFSILGLDQLINICSTKAEAKRHIDGI